MKFLFKNLVYFVVCLLVCARVNSDVIFLHQDLFGSVSHLSNESGDLIDSYSYSLYGESYQNIDEESGYLGHLYDNNLELLYMKSRFYNPKLGRFVTSDPEVFNSDNLAFSFNRYSYANGNPLKYSDPTGATVVAGIGGVFVESWNWLNGDGFNFDLLQGAFIDGYDGDLQDIGEAAFEDASNLVPGGAGLKATLLLVGKLPKAAKGISQLSRASEFGILPWKELKKYTKGTGLEAHHLIEKRMATTLGQKPRDMLSIGVTRTEHQVFTNAWRKAVPYGTDYQTLSPAEIHDAARIIYKEYPDILYRLGL